MKVIFVTPEWNSSNTPSVATFLVNEKNALEQFGVEVEVFHFTGNKNPINYLYSWIKFRIFLNNSAYDIIHAQWGQSALLAFPKKAPLVITHRGGDLEGIVDQKGKITISGRILRLLSQIMGLMANKVIIVSESLAKYLWVDKFEVIPVCLNLAIFKPIDQYYCRSILGLDQNKKYVIFPNNPNRVEKRFWLAQESIRLCNSPVELLVISGIPHSQMPYYFNAVDVLLITSKYEGSPTVVYEALACNLPIVSVNVGDVHSRINGIEGCISCKSDIPSEIANGIDKVVTNGNRLQVDNLLEEFGVERFAERMIGVYKNCLER